MRKKWLAALCLAFPAVAACGYLVAAAAPGQHGTLYLLLHLTLSALMLAVWALADAGPARWVLGAGAAARLVLFFVPSFTTHDVARYLWDGRAAFSGLDPYRLSPEAAAASGLLPGWSVAAEHAPFVTLYPPLALALFAACAALGHGLAFWAWKAIAVSASLGALWLAGPLLERHGASRHLALVALSPLLVLEAGIGAHLDALTTLAVVAALLLAARNRAVASGIALGLGGLIKFLPMLLLLPMVATKGLRFAAQMIAAASGVMAVGYVAALSLGLSPPGSLGRFFERWRFGSPVFATIETAIGAERSLALAAVLALVAVVVVALVQPGRTDSALAAPLLASPIIFPWYLSAIVPVMALTPSAMWLSWTLTAPLSYEVLDRFDGRGEWSPQAWPLWAVGVSLVVGLAFDVYRGLRQRAAVTSSSAL